MSIYALILLAFSMSMDAFAVALAKGASQRIPPHCILLSALIFGTVEAATPVIGWLLGTAAKSFIYAWDHWLAFILLGALGIKMIREGFSQDENGHAATNQNHWLMTIITAFATSIDSMVIGVGLAFMNVNITLAAISIGLATTTMTTIGLTMGHRLGKAVGKRAERFGGVVLILIGTLTLFSHLNG